MKNRNFKEMLLYFSLIFIMVMSLNLAIMDASGMELSPVKAALVTFAATAAVPVILIFPAMLAAALVPGIAWLGYRLYTDAEAVKLYMQEARKFFGWLYGYIAGYNYFEDKYTSVFALLYIIAAVLLISALVYSGRGSFLLIVLGTAALSFFWFIYVERARLYLALFLFASIMLYSYRIYEKRLKEWKASNSSIEHNVGYNWMLCSGGIIAVSLLLSLALPLNIDPVRWSWLNDKVVSVFPFIAEWRNDSMESFSYGYNSRFSLYSAGYSDKKLGGDLRQDTSVLMTVRTQGEDTLYLRGAVRDKYYESSWSKSKKSYTEYSPGSSMPIPFGSSVNTYEKALEISYKKLMTSTVFAPYSIYQVQHKSKRIYADADSEAYTSKMTMKDESYTVKSIMPYIDPDKLRQAKAEDLGEEEFKLYTAFAPDIPERVKSLALYITAGYYNNYDKAKAVEEYLRNNYIYSIKPPQLPAKAEFTDHFLFVGREGYCTYFATAMAVLLRAAGVPSRYVEGFMAKYEGEEEREVRGTNAHAWVEVFFDNYGWVNFEPTPQYPVVEYRAVQDTSGEINPELQPDLSVNNEYMPNMPDSRWRLEEDEAAGIGEADEEGRKSFYGIGTTIGLLLFFMLMLRLCVMYIIRLFKEVRLGRSSGKVFAADYIRDVVWYLGLAGHDMKQDETLREFLKKVAHKNEEGFSDISYITAILEKIRYSERNVNEEERKALLLFRREVMADAQKRAGKLKLFINLYIFGR